jgi:hypothetical protein
MMTMRRSASKYTAVGYKPAATLRFTAEQQAGGLASVQACEIKTAIANYCGRAAFPCSKVQVEPNPFLFQKAIMPIISPLRVSIYGGSFIYLLYAL